MGRASIVGRASISLTGIFLLDYIGISLFAGFMVTAYNIFVLGIPWSELQEFNLMVLFTQVAVFVVVLMFITFFRLRKLWTFKIYGTNEADITALRKRLLAFPTEVFFSTFLFALIASMGYHVLEAVVYNWEFILTDLISVILYEQSLALTIALLLYVSCRRLVRPYILALPEESISEITETSLLRPLLISFGSLLLITILPVLNYVLVVQSKGTALNLKVLFGIAGFYFTFAVIIFRLPLLEFQRELQLLIAGMRSLLQGNRSNLHNKMPVLSQDEIGQLGLSFNALQERIAREYAEVEKELELAYQVQQRLLPSNFYEINDCQIAAFCKPGKEVGGDFYNIVQLDEGSFAVMVGDVSGKGLPAALLMSAVLALLKYEVRNGGSAGEVLTRLNKTIEETVNGEMFVTLGLGFFKPHQGVLEYASAGHLPPYRLRNCQPEEVFISSLPLGVASDEVYQQWEHPIQPGDRWFFYTDGIIEAVDGQEMLGFPGFVGYLTGLDERLSVQEQVNLLEQQLPISKNSRLDDDRTLVLVKI
ncbi:MAG: PP2C family protein-serine/threonine phosphatase [Carboxydocellales bacterium]